MIDWILVANPKQLRGSPWKVNGIPSAENNYKIILF